MASTSNSCDTFNNLSSKIAQLLYGRTTNDRNLISTTLDKLNVINYKYCVVTNTTKAVLLVHQCCSLIPADDLELVLKCCQLITNLTAKQNVAVEGRTLTVAVQWCLQALKGQSLDADILVALDALLRHSAKPELIVDVMKSTTIIGMAEDWNAPELALLSLKCIEACTCPPDDVKTSTLPNYSSQTTSCFQIFLKRLIQGKPPGDALINTKIAAVCLRGVQNLVMQTPDLLDDELGVVLGVIKCYMLLGIKGIEFVPPQKLMPSTLSIPELATNMVRENTGGKISKQRKYRTQPSATKVVKKEMWNDEHGVHSGFGLDEGNNFGNFSKTSDSDFSDGDGGSAARLGVMLARMRQTALALFLRTVKLVHKTVMFSYWSSFIPENPLTNKHNLITCILKDTSNKGRMAALNVLLVLLATSKLYLAQAEKGENVAFTPFSVILGLIIKELHKCLSLALNENFIPVLNMVLKCLAALVQATPYHRLQPGLITKVARNVKALIYHKDITVQVTALIVLGCILASEPTVPETTEYFTRHCSENVQEQPCSDCDQFAEVSSDEEESVVKRDVPWLLDRCLWNLTEEVLVSNLVKMESLQIISAMSRNHFESMLACYLPLVTLALDAALANKYSDIRLHAGRAVDSLGHAIVRFLSGDHTNLHSFGPKCLAFWQTLLKASLPSLLHDDQNPILRSIGCDCLGSIGGEIFEQLARDKQILTITLLFACSRDEDNSVKAAAIRALAICVLHPTLREDLGFVADTAEAILRVLHDENFAVKVKCSWSLGNLSEALILNKSNPCFGEELPNSLLLKLLKGTVQASKASDKIKMNGVRALGNFLQMIDGDLIENGSFKGIIQEGIDILVESCTTSSNMKVRWNSCHAIANAMKNPSLFTSTVNFQEKVFNALTDLVMNYRNFKVRINAAVALSSPTRRQFYQQHYHQIFISLVKGLETSQKMEDFSEYKHRDHLIEQICLTLGYLITLLNKSDFGILKESIFCDHLKQHLKRIWERLLPEKSTIFFDARTHLVDLLTNEDLTLEQKSTLHYLSEILTQDN